ncbi:MAG TPA: cytochrome P450 [Streptosporangiaceae bacterium]|nr:cytochrome P450 [Streptosporangiaceae bacterium]
MAQARYPLGAGVTVASLAADPHPTLRRLREAEPVSWLPALSGWLVTRADLADQVLRNPGAFTVDDPRFTTARVVGPSMLSLDGAEHSRHRDPFAAALRLPQARAELAQACEREAARLVAALAAAGTEAELRRGLAGQLAVSVMAAMLGLDVAPSQLLTWYDAIVAGVSALSEGDGPAAAVPAGAAAAFAELSDCVQASLARPGKQSVLTAAAGQLAAGEIVSNAAVMLFGGIETTEGMICNTVWYLLGDDASLGEVTADRSLAGSAVEEALRLEPAAAVVDRYATADVKLGSAEVRERDLVIVSLAGANRDPAVFANPDRFELHRQNARQHWSFAVGPHFCVGAQLARAEARAALGALLDQLPGLRLDRARPSAPQGLVFRKPASLHVRWDSEARVPADTG